MSTCGKSTPPTCAMLEWDVLRVYYRQLMKAYESEKMAKVVLKSISAPPKQHKRYNIFTDDGVVTFWVEINPIIVSDFETELARLIDVMISRLGGVLNNTLNKLDIMTLERIQQQVHTVYRGSEAGREDYTHSECDESFMTAYEQCQKQCGFITAVYSEKALEEVMRVDTIVDYVLILLRDAYFEYTSVPIVPDIDIIVAENMRTLWYI